MTNPTNPKNILERFNNVEFKCIDRNGFNVSVHVDAEVELQLKNGWTVENFKFIKIRTDNMCDYPRFYTGENMESDAAVEIGASKLMDIRLTLQCQAIDLHNNYEPEDMPVVQYIHDLED